MLAECCWRRPRDHPTLCEPPPSLDTHLTLRPALLLHLSALQPQLQHSSSNPTAEHQEQQQAAAQHQARPHTRTSPGFGSCCSCYTSSRRQEHQEHTHHAMLQHRQQRRQARTPVVATQRVAALRVRLAHCCCGAVQQWPGAVTVHRGCAAAAGL